MPDYDAGAVLWDKTRWGGRKGVTRGEKRETEEGEGWGDVYVKQMNTERDWKLQWAEMLESISRLKMEMT